MKSILFTNFKLITLSIFITLSVPTAFASEPQESERLAPPLAKQAKLAVKSESAETLYSITEGQLFEDGHWLRRYYVSIRLNDQSAARDYGRIAIRFNHYYTDTILEFANTLTRDGRVIALSQDAVQNRVTGGGQDFYSDSSEIVFSLADTSPGTILEFQYLKKSKNLPFPELHSFVSIPHWFQNTVANDNWRADFVHHYSYSFTHPSETKIYSETFGGHSSKAKKTQRNNTTKLQWKMKNIEAVTAERWFPRKEKVYPQLEVSTMTDWSAVDRWTWMKIADKLPPKKELFDLIRDWKLEESSSQHEKTRKVYAYVQKNIRYVFAHLGRGGYEPHYPLEVLNSRYGDCKDQTVLTLTLLRTLGIEAYAALVETPRAGHDDTQLVKLIFDHMLVYIPAQGDLEETWLDTTGDHALYPGMSTYLSGQNAFVVNGKGGLLTKIPDLRGQNKVYMQLDYTQNDDESSNVEMTLNLSGSFEQEMRSWWINDSDRDTSLNQYLQNIFNNAIEYSVEGELLNSENLFEPVAIKANFHFPNADEKTPVQAASIKQLINLFADTSQLPLPESRTHRFVDPYRYVLQVDAKFASQNQVSPALIQSSGNYNNNFYTLEQSGKAEGSNFLYTSTFTRFDLNLSPEQYSQYYEASQKLNKLDPWIVSLAPSAKTQSQQSINEIEGNFGKESVQMKIALARQLIEQGKFESALIHANAAVKLDKNNGEAWYILATAQGFNTMLEKSSDSFAKAEALGYNP